MLFVITRMDFAMPPAFPETEFRAFAIAVNDFPPNFPSYEYLDALMNDRLKKKAAP